MMAKSCTHDQALLGGMFGIQHGDPWNRRGLIWCCYAG